MKYISRTLAVVCFLFALVYACKASFVRSIVPGTRVLMDGHERIIWPAPFPFSLFYCVTDGYWPGFGSWFWDSVVFFGLMYVAYALVIFEGKINGLFAWPFQFCQFLAEKKPALAAKLGSFVGIVAFFTARELVRPSSQRHKPPRHEVAAYDAGRAAVDYATQQPGIVRHMSETAWPSSHAVEQPATPPPTTYSAPPIIEPSFVRLSPYENRPIDFEPPKPIKPVYRDDRFAVYESAYADSIQRGHQFDCLKRWGAFLAYEKQEGRNDEAWDKSLGLYMSAVERWQQNKPKGANSLSSSGSSRPLPASSSPRR